MTRAASTPLPAGFVPARRPSPLLDLFGPLYECDNGLDYRLALRLDQDCATPTDRRHDGILAAFAEAYLGRLCARAGQPALSLAPASLTLSYLGAARAGDWLEARGRIDHARRAVALSSSVISANGKPVLKASAVFQIVARARRGRSASA